MATVNTEHDEMAKFLAGGDVVLGFTLMVVAFFCWER